MVVSAAKCPECGAKMRFPKPVPAGKTIKCPKCGDAFAVADDGAEERRSTPTATKKSSAKAKVKTKLKAAPAAEVPDEADEDFDEEQQPRKKKKKKKAGASGGKGLWLALGGGGAVVAIAVVVIVLVSSGGGGQNLPAGNPNNPGGNNQGAINQGGNNKGGNQALPKPPAQASLDAYEGLKLAMTPEQVTTMLGPGDDSSANEMRSIVQAAASDVAAGIQFGLAQSSGAQRYLKWASGPDTFFVGFAKIKDGREVLAFTTRAHQGGKIEGPVGIGALFRSDLTKEAEKLQQDIAFMQDAKWLKGPELRKRIVGEWHDEKLQTVMLLKEDGAYHRKNTSSPGPESKGTWRSLSDEQLETSVESLFKGNKLVVSSFRLLMTQDELYLVDETPYRDRYDIKGPYFQIPFRKGSAIYAKLVEPNMAKLGNRKTLDEGAATLIKLGPTLQPEFPKLAGMTKDADKAVRQWGVVLVGAIGPVMTEQGLPLMRAMLKDKEENVVNAAIQQLSKYGAAAKVAIPDLQDVTRRLPFSFVKFQAEQMINQLEGL